MFTYILYLSCIAALCFSWRGDRARTKKALLKAWKAFENILPQFLGVLVFVSVSLAYLDAAAISKIIGNQSGWWGVAMAAVVGAITLIPGFVAFPTAALLLKSGAGLMQIGAFVSTLMMVGIVTMPVEMKYFGKKLTVWRNLLSFGFSLLVAWVIGMVAR